MWAKCAEAMLPANPKNVFLSINLTNCFGYTSREHLIDELLQHEELAELARYVQCTYPPGMVAWAELGRHN
jgi:hypothetical protein